MQTGRRYNFGAGDHAGQPVADGERATFLNRLRRCFCGVEAMLQPRCDLPDAEGPSGPHEGPTRSGRPGVRRRTHGVALLQLPARSSRLPFHPVKQAENSVRRNCRDAHHHERGPAPRVLASARRAVADSRTGVDALSVRDPTGREGAWPTYRGDLLKVWDGNSPNVCR